MLKIFIINALSDNYIYLLRNEHKNITSVIDPGEAEPVINFLNNKRWHLDEVKNRISNIDILVSDNETINITGIPTKVFHTPGHTLGHVCFYMPDEKCLFSGDTLFYLGCGRVFEGTMDQMWSSLMKLKSLPDDTSVYCGHEYTLSNMKFANNIDTSNALLNKISLEIKNKREKGLPTVPFNLGVEKKINPFLRADDDNFIKSVGLNNNNSSESFAEIRLKKDSF